MKINGKPVRIEIEASTTEVEYTIRVAGIAIRRVMTPFLARDYVDVLTEAFEAVGIEIEIMKVGFV